MRGRSDHALNALYSAANLFAPDLCATTAPAVATVQAQVRQRVLRADVRRRLLDQSAGEQMGGWDHGGGFSVNALVRIIAFITEPSTVRQILEYLGEPPRPPRFAPARGPPLWESAAAAPPAGNAPRWELAAQTPAQIEFDQRLVW